MRVFTFALFLLSIPTEAAWGTEPHEAIFSRSSSDFYDRLSFVFRIINADGSERYENGDPGTWSFFEAKIENFGAPCAGGGIPLPEFRPIDVSIARR